MAFEFWPDSTNAQARTNLRQALHHLRHALRDADSYVRLGTSSVQWLADGPAEIDVVEFEADATAGLASDDEEALARAASRYRGDFLVGCYDEWAAPERERLRALAVAVLRALVTIARRRGDWARAVDDGERLLRLDPLDESSYRLLIEAHASAGDRARALRLYHECVAVLDRELAVGPHPDTIALYEALMTRGGLARADDPTSAPVWDRSPLIGRDHELGELVAAWHQTAPGRPRFVLVAGEPGIGKSRLVRSCSPSAVARGQPPWPLAPTRPTVRSPTDR